MKTSISLAKFMIMVSRATLYEQRAKSRENKYKRPERVLLH